MTTNQKLATELPSLPEQISDEVRESSKHWNVIKELPKGVKLKKILIIEDQPDIRRLLKMTMDFSNYEVHEASEADSGFGMIKAIKPDLILLDIMMPGEVNGLQLCTMLKSSESFQHIPIVLLTARGQLVDRQAGLAAGANEYLVKPFSPIKLIETVESLLLKAKAE